MFQKVSKSKYPPDFFSDPDISVKVCTELDKGFTDSDDKNVLSDFIVLVIRNEGDSERIVSEFDDSLFNRILTFKDGMEKDSLYYLYVNKDSIIKYLDKASLEDFMAL